MPWVTTNRDLQISRIIFVAATSIYDVRCHLLAANQRQPPTTEAPPFATIARRPDFDARRLAVFLLNPYPNLSLSRAEAEDATAYIASLRR